jgi:hypothetical protein
MRISDLRDFINKIPKEMDDFQIMFRRFEDEGDTLLYLDYPLTAMYIDEENKESVFLDEDNWTYFSDNILLESEDDDPDSKES